MSEISVNELRLMAQNTKLKMNSLHSEAKVLLTQANSLNQEHSRLNEQLLKQYQELKKAMDAPEGMEVNLETGELYEPETPSG